MGTQCAPSGVVQISGCEVCGDADLVTVLDLGKHPLCDDLIRIGDRRLAVNYPISIAYCRTCKTAHQSYQVPKKTLFPDSYHYRARHTADVLNGMRQLVQSCKAQLGDLAGLRILDIGCNDGSLLSIFGEERSTTFGIEPTAAAEDAKAAGHTVYRDYLSPVLAERFVAAHARPDLITFTNVFAHIEDLPSVLDAVKILMAPSTILVIENHYLGAVLDRYQFDTFYHEHPRTYSLTSFKYIADTLSAKIVNATFPARYGGNIRVMMQSKGAGDNRREIEFERIAAREAGFESGLAAMARRIPQWCEAKRKVLESAVAQHGPLPAKAFPGRAAILVRLLELDETMVSAVYEKPGSMKLGHYLPGTRIPILSDDEFERRSTKDAPLINFAWHIPDEIHSYMRKRGFTGDIIDIFAPEEFERLE